MVNSGRRPPRKRDLSSKKPRRPKRGIDADRRIKKAAGQRTDGGGAWHFIGRSIGSRHKGPGHVNQDAICHVQPGDTALPLLVAVSDGHGSAKHVRSSTGALYAVQAAVEAIQESLALALRKDTPLNLSEVKRWSESHLPRRIHDSWMQKVEEDFSNHPFEPAELSKVKNGSGIRARDALKRDFSVAYGATILSVCIAPRFIIYLQLGDGDILTVSECGTVSYPLPEDRDQVANETRSLCQRRGWNAFRIGFQPLHPSPPELIAICTDGYSNAFPDISEGSRGFSCVGRDILRCIRENGPDFIEENIESWLLEASKYTGDDATLGIVHRRGDSSIPLAPKSASGDRDS